MKKKLRTTLAAATVAAVAAGGTLSVAPTAGAEGAAPAARAGSLTDFGMRADVYGVRLITENIQALSLKDAHAQQRCTRGAGQVVDKSSLISLPDNPLIKAGLSDSRTETYRNGGVTGMRGVNTLGSIAIGGEVADGTTLPKLTFKGLTTVADAFNKDGRFGHRESFTFDGITLDLLDDTVLEELPPELQNLLAPLEEASGMVFTGTEEVVNQVIAALVEATGPVEIPGLGSIALGSMRGTATKKGATSRAAALEVNIQAGETRQQLQLGGANALIGAPAPVGVFRASSSALDLTLLDEMLKFGSVEQKAIPCEGTLGRTVTHQVPKAQQLLGLLTDVTGVTYAHKGTQMRRKKRAVGFTSTRIDSVTIPVADLTITDVFSKVRMVKTKRSKKVKRQISTSVGSIMVGDEVVAVPAPGQVVELPGGIGNVQFRKITQSKYGAKAIALRVKLFEENVVLDLGKADGRIYPR